VQLRLIGDGQHLDDQVRLQGRDTRSVVAVEEHVSRKKGDVRFQSSTAGTPLLVVQRQVKAQRRAHALPRQTFLDARPRVQHPPSFGPVMTSFGIKK
jgi:hypothetical protein